MLAALLRFNFLGGLYMSFLSHLISGVSLGSIYAIIALGYTMVYGIAKMLNFAHGDVIMVGAYVCFFAVSRYDMPVIPSVLLAVAACTALGVFIERLAYKPLRSAPSLAVLITAIGMSYFLQNSAQLLWTSNPKVFSSVVGNGSVKFFDGRLSISYNVIVTVLACIIIMSVLTWFTGRTKMGKAMRACSEDKDAAQLMGINVNATISMTFAIGSALAAVAGVLLCSVYPTLMPTTGSMPGIKAFTAAVFGGIGSIPGALLGGTLLGVIEIFAKAYISTQLSDAIVFLVLIIVLLVKPAGLLGKQVQEKV
ncbi:branched-chain amino acid ABC transporter permease [Synergistales bacterium]|nr:branched-chain amino acid ABC transporter permease [Synergistales bacterium]